jgi:hypothetical protein
MALSLFGRRAMRPACLSTRAMDWVALSQKVSSDQAKSEINRLRDLHADFQSMAAKVSSEAAPIDWAAYRATIKTPGLVDTMEKEYNALNLPKFTNAVEAEATDVFAKLVADAEESMNSSKARLEELEAMIEQAQAEMTTKDTTIDEVLARYPEIGAEIQDDIDNDRWFIKRN